MEMPRMPYRNSVFSFESHLIPLYPFLSGSSRLRTDVAVQVVDVNDNRPEFLFPQRYSRVFGDKYLAALAHDAPLETAFTQVQVSSERTNYRWISFI